MDPVKLMGEIDQVLDDLDERAGGLIAVAVLMKTGIPVSSRIKTNVDEAFLSASLATLLNVALELSDKVFTERPARVILDTEAGSLILQSITPEIVLVSIFKKQHLGAMLLLIEQAARQLAQLLPSD